MLRGLIFASFLLGPFIAAAEGELFRLPSYISLQVGAGKDQYRDSSLNLGLSLPGNWQIDAGADRTITKASDGTEGEVSTSGYRLGFGSDPLRLFSVRLLAEGWSLQNVEARGGRIGLVFAPGLWTFSADWIGQAIQFSSLPILLNRDGQETVQDSGFSLRISTMAVKNWNFFVAGAGHTYDHDLSRLYEIPALILNRVPVSVLTTLTGLSKSDASLGAIYMLRNWDVGLEGGRSVSAVDNVKTRRLGVNATYYLNPSWSFALSTMAFKPETAEENSDATHSSSLTVIYKW